MNLFDAQAAMSGSAPLARGTDVCERLGEDRARFSPACAGNSAARRRSPPASAVQPRLRGEQSSSSVSAIMWHGSAPLARGTACEAERAYIETRFSPACAGNRCRPAAAMEAAPVQPRLRGEQTNSFGQSAIGGGSAPLARGTAANHRRRRGGERFNPACAGNRCTPPLGFTTRAVQPRLRGEQIFRHDLSKAAHGSAPLTRGTASATAIFNVPTVQPRLRGEQTTGSDAQLIDSGSAPLARGTGVEEKALGLNIRFSPACAGNRRASPA